MNTNHPIAWFILADTVVTALALVFAAAAFLTYRSYMRQCLNVVQAQERRERRAELTDMLQPETPAERTQPHGDLPLLCGDERPTRLEFLPTVGDLQAGERR